MKLFRPHWLPLFPESRLFLAELPQCINKDAEEVRWWLLECRKPILPSVDLVPMSYVCVQCSSDRHDVMSSPFAPPPVSLSLTSLPSRLNWPHRWNEINNMSHNRSFFALELTNREESVQFQTVSHRRCTPPPHTPPPRPIGHSQSRPI